MDDLPIIDAHHHLWDLGSGPLHYPWLQGNEHEPFFLGETAPLRRDYLPADYRQDSLGHRVVATVHVEAECSRTQQVTETEWLVGLMGRDGLPNVIVAHAWLHTPDAEVMLARQAGFPAVRGIRSKPVTRGARDAPLAEIAGSMRDPAWRRGLGLLSKYGLSWDLRVPTWHLEEAADVVRENPALSVVLNHMGFPWDRSPAGLDLWRDGMKRLAEQPNCWCKLSCLCLPDGPWDYESNRALVLETIERFGVERCMFASNFPVDGLRVSFRTLFDDFKRMTAAFSAADRAHLFHDNAARFYRIPS